MHDVQQRRSHTREPSDQSSDKCHKSDANASFSKQEFLLTSQQNEGPNFDSTVRTKMSWIIFRASELISKVMELLCLAMNSTVAEIQCTRQNTVKVTLTDDSLRLQQGKTVSPISTSTSRIKTTIRSSINTNRDHFICFGSITASDNC